MLKTMGGIVFNLMFKFSKELEVVFSYFTLLILNNNFCFTMLFSDGIYKFMGRCRCELSKISVQSVM